jgi:hypothetical protein
MAEAFIRFAATGDPNNSEDEHWPTAFTFGGTRRHQSDPRSLSVQVIGGPLGTGSTYQTPASSDSDEEGFEVGDEEQQIMQGHTMRGMSSKVSRLRDEVLGREKLLDRCSFMNTLSEKLGV